MDLEEKCTSPLGGVRTPLPRRCNVLTSGVTQLGQRELPLLPQAPVCGAGPKLLGATLNN